MADTLDILRGLQSLGYDHLIATPHVYQEYYPNSSDTIRKKLAEVREAATEAGIDLRLEASAEYMLDERFQELMAEDDLLPFGKNHILVELGFLAEPPNVEDTFFQLRTKGYRPILAHPERYLYLADDLDRYARFRELGALLQVNILSLVGHYGPEIKKLGWQLIKNDLADLLGTDCHHTGHVEKLQAALGDRKVQKVLQKGEWLNGTLTPVE